MPLFVLVGLLVKAELDTELCCCGVAHGGFARKSMFKDFKKKNYRNIASTLKDSRLESGPGVFQNVQA